MTIKEALDKLYALAAEVSSRGRIPIEARMGEENYAALLSHAGSLARYVPRPPRTIEVRPCVCGHSAGHHDDEPAGCWECSCEAWHGNASAPAVTVESPASPSTTAFTSLAWYTPAGPIALRSSPRLIDAITIRDSTGEWWPSE